MTDTSHSVAELVNLAQQGDRDAWGELVLRYQTMVSSTIYKRMHNYADADGLSQELFQDVFLQAFRKLDQLREPQHFGSWIRSIAIRTAINKWVHAERHYHAVSFGQKVNTVVCEYTDAPDDRILEQERMNCLHRGISRLCKMDRDTLTEFYLRDKSILEMSEEFDTPSGTIKRRLHVARKRLAVELEGSMLA